MAREEILRVRLMSAEMEALREHARDSGLPVSHVVRLALVKSGVTSASRSDGAWLGDVTKDRVDVERLMAELAGLREAVRRLEERPEVKRVERTGKTPSKTPEYGGEPQVLLPPREVLQASVRGGVRNAAVARKCRCDARKVPAKNGVCVGCGLPRGKE